MYERKVYDVRNTRFIFQTNFAGDPRRDKFGSSERIGNLIIPDVDMARDLIDQGFRVKLTKPRDGEEDGFIPSYFVKVRLKYGSKYPPDVYLVSGQSAPVLLDEDSIAAIDTMRIQNVNALLASYWKEGNDNPTLYIQTMYVEQSLNDDPYAEMYARRSEEKALNPDEEKPW